MEMNRITRKVLSTVIATLFLATSAFFAAAQGPSATTLVVGHPIDPPGLNPLGHNSAIFESVTASTVEKLLYTDAHAPEIMPGLAEDWEWSADGTVLTLHLKTGVRFHNGEPFNAEAAKFSIEQLMASTFLSTFTRDLGLTSIDVLGESTVALRFAAPAGNALFVLARAGFIVPPGYYQEVGGDGFALSPVGTGPYQFVEWVKDDHVTFEAFADYWGGPPALQEIIWRIIPEQSSLVSALVNGEIDLATSITPASRGRVTNNADLRLITSPGLRQFVTFFDMRIDHPVADATVRRALNYAVDKQALITLFEGEAEALFGQYLTPAVLGFNPDVDPFNYDPDRARELLAEAGYSGGFSMTLKYTVGRYPLDREMGEVVSAYLEAVGVRVEQIPLDIVEFNRQHSEEPTMGPAWQWGLLTPADPHNTLGLFRPGTFFARYPDNPRIQELLAAGLRETDLGQRAAIYNEVNQIWNDDPLGIYLIVPNDLYAARTTVEGFVPRSDQVVDLTMVSKTQ